MGTTLRNIIDGGADVYADGRYLGEVRRGTVAFRPRPGQADDKTVWFAVPRSRAAHAHTDGCPHYPTRREAAQALATGSVVL